MTKDQITLLMVGAAGLVAMIAWIVLVVVPAWTSYWRLRERLLAFVMSVYVLVAFAGAGALVGVAFLYYYDRL